MAQSKPSFPAIDLALTHGRPKARDIPRHVDPDRLPAVMIEQEVSNYTGLSMTKLARLRHDGGGPIFKKVGREHLYQRANLLAWLSQH